MMELRIRELLGIEAAAVTLEPGAVVEVIGPNAAGKTSIAVCAQAVLARDPNPLRLSAAEARKAYLRGSDPGTATLVAAGDYQVAWEPGAGCMSAPTQPPHDKAAAPPEAVGLVDFCTRRTAREQAALFQAVLLPPAAEVGKQVRARLGEHLDPDDIAGVMATAHHRGWKAAATIYDDRTRESKRAWEGVTNRRWGSKVASDWRPDGWTADDDALSAQEADAAVVEARDGLAALHRVEAATEAELDAAERAAEELPALEQRLADALAVQGRTGAALTEARDAATRLQGERLELQREIGRVERQASPETVPCPHCDRPLLVTAVAIIAADCEAIAAAVEQQATALDTLRSEMATVTGHIDPAEAKLRGARDAARVAAEDVSDARLAVGQARAAAAMGGRVVDSDCRRRRLAAAEEGVEKARAAAGRVKARDRATELHGTILRYGAVATALGPRGVRQQLLWDGLARLNAGLTQLSLRAHWPLTLVSPESGAVLIRDRPAVLCSESEQWRAQALIQLTLAALTGAAAVVLDRGDLLDEGSRKGLQTLAKAAGSTGIAVLLCSSDMPHVRTATWPQVRIKDGRMA